VCSSDLGKKKFAISAFVYLRQLIQATGEASD
jgi:hypothetical protein